MVLKEYLYSNFGQNELKVYHAEDGLTGVKSAERIQPDLIVLDVALPLISGIGVYKKLKNTPRLSHSKFIIMSANLEYKPQGEVFLQKPLKGPLFIEIVRELIGL
jgi:DNA-binding response OmpR family regulator